MSHINLHATCIRIAAAGAGFSVAAGAGVLLIGKSGSGKSDLALRLIGRGAELVSDDRTNLAVIDGLLVGTAPASIAGQMEVRGVGIVEVRTAPRAAIALVVDLDMQPERLPEPRRFAPPGLDLAEAAQPRLIALNALEASAPDKVLAALGNIVGGVKRIS